MSITTPTWTEWESHRVILVIKKLDHLYLKLYRRFFGKRRSDRKGVQLQIHWNRSVFLSRANRRKQLIVLFTVFIKLPWYLLRTAYLNYVTIFGPKRKKKSAWGNSLRNFKINCTVGLDAEAPPNISFNANSGSWGISKRQYLLLFCDFMYYFAKSRIKLHIIGHDPRLAEMTR